MSSSASVGTPITVVASSSRAELNNATASPIEGSHLPLDPSIVIRNAPIATEPSDVPYGHQILRPAQEEEELEQETLPPYLEEPPAYSSSGSSEPITLAMYLFKFGFLFPPFWIIGSLILLSPLRQPESTPSSVWLPEKTESEREEIIQKMRKAEVRWAKRCLVALCILLVLVIVGALAVWAVLKA
ncbi:hypothetical protein F5878DRAFT_655589 [Lentinula raphanica]|uniref:Transmembrane protein n=1 Tax=Lentinula raphanica TaxID=153919 RepID=A0AA38PKV9_9AGAR|nr:hypothetical protein C8R42DRAFT_645438 [Lentinula raphanica]KAJ3844774.1 hypothetical protein F5878DRAFT_655589 [Lentinula raphanica]